MGIGQEKWNREAMARKIGIENSKLVLTTRNDTEEVSKSRVQTFLPWPQHCNLDFLLWFSWPILWGALRILFYATSQEIQFFSCQAILASLSRWNLLLEHHYHKCDRMRYPAVEKYLQCCQLSNINYNGKWPFYQTVWKFEFFLPNNSESTWNPILKIYNY